MGKNLILTHIKVRYEYGRNEKYIGNEKYHKKLSRGSSTKRAVSYTHLEYIIKFSPTSGGLVFDMLTHDYDTARWLIGSEVDTIFGMGGVFAYEGLGEVGDIDNCTISLGFENGVMCLMEASRNSTYCLLYTSRCV